LGEGVQMDLAEAAKWLRMAADQGNAEAEKALIALREVAAARRPASQPQASTASINIEMSVAATPTNPPTITGTTNLPNGSLLMVSLLADRPCAPNCYAQAKTTVQNGRFTVPFSIIMMGPYTIDVLTPSLQPTSVQAVIGRSGEHLGGPYVVTLSK